MTDFLSKASQPVRDALLIVSAMWFIAIQGGVIQGPVQRTDPRAMDEEASESFARLVAENHRLFVMHEEGKLPDGRYAWYGLGLEPLMKEILTEERKQTALLAKLVRNGG